MKRQKRITMPTCSSYTCVRFNDLAYALNVNKPHRDIYLPNVCRSYLGGICLGTRAKNGRKTDAKSMLCCQLRLFGEIPNNVTDNYFSV